MLLTSLTRNSFALLGVHFVDFTWHLPTLLTWRCFALLTKHLPSLFDIHLIYLLPYVKSTYLYGANFTYLARSCLAYLNSLLYLMRFILTLTWFDLTLLARHAPSSSDAYDLPTYLPCTHTFFSKYGSSYGVTCQLWIFQNSDHIMGMLY